jgi:hypothetical protein
MHLTLYIYIKPNRIYEMMSTLIADRLGKLAIGGGGKKFVFFADARDLTLSCSAYTDEKIENPE